jgi:hypothetical protein
MEDRGEEVFPVFPWTRFAAGLPGLCLKVDKLCTDEKHPGTFERMGFERVTIFIERLIQLFDQGSSRGFSPGRSVDHEITDLLGSFQSG